MTEILGNGTKGQNDIVNCGSSATALPRDGPCFFSFSFFSRFLETVSCTRFWVIYFYGFERGDGVEKGRKKYTHTHTLDKKRVKEGKKYKMCVYVYRLL